MVGPKDYIGGPVDPSHREVPTGPQKQEGIEVEHGKHSPIDVTAKSTPGSIPTPAESITVERPSDEMEAQMDGQLEDSIEKLDLYMHLSEILSTKTPPTFREWILENRETIVDDLLEGKWEIEGRYEQEISVQDIPARVLNHLALQGVLLGKESDLDEKAIYGALVHLLPRTSKKDAQYYRKELFHQLSIYLVDLQKEFRSSRDPEIKDKIIQLNNWLNKQRYKPTSTLLMKAEKGIELTGSALKMPLMVLAKTIGFLRYLDAVAGIATLGVSNVFKLGENVFELARTVRKKMVTKTWQKKFHEQERTVDLTNPAGQAEAKAKIQKLLAERKANEERKFVDARPQFYYYLRTLANEASSVEDIKNSLALKGVHLEEIEGVPLDSLEDLKIALTNLTVKEKLLSSYVRHQESIQLSIRQALKTSETSKILQIQKELNRKLGFDVVKLGLTVILGSTVIVLNALVFASVITLPSFALPILGVSFLITGIVVGAVGLIYFYRSNPHRFKAMVKGINLHLLAYQIPSAYRNYFLKRKKRKQREELAQTYVLRVKIREIEAYLKQIPLQEARKSEKLSALTEKKLNVGEAHRYREQLKKLEELQKKKLDDLEIARVKRAQKIAELEKKVEYWNNKKAPLEKRLRYAGVADLLRANRLDKDKEGNPLNISKLVAEGVFANPKFLDQETLHILDRYFNINVEKMRADREPDLERKMAEQLDIYFSNTPAQFTKYIKKRMNEIRTEEASADLFRKYYV